MTRTATATDWDFSGMASEMIAELADSMEARPSANPVQAGWEAEFIELGRQEIARRERAAAGWTQCPKCKDNPGLYFFVIHNCFGTCFRCGGTGLVNPAEEKRNRAAASELTSVRAAIFAEVRTRPGHDRFDFATETLSLGERVRSALDHLAAHRPDALARLVASVQAGRVADVVDALAVYAPTA